MLKGFKTEIKVNEKQQRIIHQSLGICRYLYNSYLAKNQELYQQYKDGLIDKKQSFISAIDFDKYINNEVKVQEGFEWINLCGSKARKKRFVMPKLHIKNSSKVNLIFLDLKRKTNKILNYIFLKIIKLIGK